VKDVSQSSLLVFGSQSSVDRLIRSELREFEPYCGIMLPYSRLRSNSTADFANLRY